MQYAYNNDLNTEHVLELVKELQLLHELKLHLGHELSVDDAIRFWDEHKQLKKFHFVLENILSRSQSKINDLCTRLGGKSAIFTLDTHNTRFIILERIIA